MAKILSRKIGGTIAAVKRRLVAFAKTSGSGAGGVTPSIFMGIIPFLSASIALHLRPLQ